MCADKSYLWVIVIALLLAFNLLKDYYYKPKDASSSAILCLIVSMVGLVATAFGDLSIWVLFIPVCCSLYMVLHLFGYYRSS